LEKKIPVWVLAFVIFLGINLSIVFGWMVQHASEGGTQLGSIGPVVMAVARFPTTVKTVFREIGGPSPLVVEDRFPGLDGFKKNGTVQPDAAADPGYLLLSAYSPQQGQSTAKLVRIRDGQTLHEWTPSISTLASAHQTVGKFFDATGLTDARFGMMHPLLLEDGSLVFHGRETPLFKLDACSRLQWVTNGVFHHSLEQGPLDGHLWAPSVIEPTSYDERLFPGFKDDAIADVSADGKLLSRISVSRLLEENGYRGLLFGTRKYEWDGIHLNDVEQAGYSTKYWERGDLLLSLRHLSTVLIYRPSTGKVIWLQTGPWLNQHDASFVGQSRIGVFGNDVRREFDGQTLTLVDGHNQAYFFDFTDNAITAPYTVALKKSNVRTLSEGRQDLIENGDLFVEETNDGRLLRLSADRVVWEFVVRVDNNTLGRVNWSRYLSNDKVGRILPRLASLRCS
jgi:hypothetical protein